MHYEVQMTQWEAIVGAANELGHEGGGTMHLHRPDCGAPELSEDCGCRPIAIEVPALT